MAETGAVPPDTGRRLGRVDSFSDGLFSIAATLLVLSIDVPNVPEADLNGALDSLLPSLLAYFISFAVVGLFWLRHHEFFGRLQASDSRLAALNLVFLAFIALLPVPTEILGKYDNSTAPVVIYAVFILTLSVLLRALFHHARNARVVRARAGGAGGQRQRHRRVDGVRPVDPDGVRDPGPRHVHVDPGRGPPASSPSFCQDLGVACDP